jgi:hypothetical protein
MGEAQLSLAGGAAGEEVAEDLSPLLLAGFPGREAFEDVAGDFVIPCLAHDAAHCMRNHAS